MAGTITTGAHPKALWPGVHDWFGASYAEYPEEYPELFSFDNSSMNYEEDVEQTGFGLANVKNEGASISFDTESQGYTKRYRHVAYALGYICTYEEKMDNLYEKVSKRRARKLAFSMRQTKEIVGANVYNRAFNASYTGGDGVSLGNSAHPTFGAGTQSNILSTAADLSEASLESMLIQIAQAKNSRGLTIALRGQKLIIPVNLMFEAERILKSQLRVDTANNDINAVRNMGLLPQGITVNHYLTDTDAWFIRTDCPNGLMFFDRDHGRGAPLFDQDNDFDTKNAKAAAYMRFSVGWTDWRDLFATPGA